MRFALLLSAAIALLSFTHSALFPNSALAEAVVGKPAPSFSASDSNGKTHSLADFKGKYVVLEWLNHGCPFVRKHYETGNLQKLQTTYTTKGVVWLSVASSAEGKQGFMTPEETNLAAKEKNTASTAILLDSEGTVGKAYGAKTTPHMFVINPEGTLIYAGALDDDDSTRSSGVAGAKNYVAQALDEAMAGKAVSTSTTDAYGCSIKYKS